MNQQLAKCTTVFLPPLPEVGCPKILDIRNPWGKKWKEEVSDMNILVLKWLKIAKQKKYVLLADFALQNMVETTLPD